MSGSATTASAADAGAALTCSMGAISRTRMLFLTRLLCCSACINVSGEPRLQDIQQVVPQPACSSFVVSGVMAGGSRLSRPSVPT